jgi:hypothetical protein
MSGTDYIDTRIAQRQKTLAELNEQETEIQRKKLIIEGELRAYLDAKGNASPAVSPVRRRGRPRITPKSTPTNSAMNGHAHDFSAFAVSRMSAGWRSIFSAMATNPAAITTTIQMSRIAQAAGHPIIGQSLRSGTHKYAERKWIERVKNGEYRLTPTGVAIATALKSETPLDK